MSLHESHSTQGPAQTTNPKATIGSSPAWAEMLRGINQRQMELKPRRGFGAPHLDAKHAAFVKVGLIAKYKTDASGRRQIVSLIFPGDAIIPNPAAAGCGFEAIVPSEIIAISKDDFDKALFDVPGLALVCLRSLQRDAAISEEWLLNCGSRDTRTRVAHLLCELAVRIGAGDGQKTFINPFTQSHLAEMTGQTSVNVNRVLSDFERAGLLTREGRKFEITDWDEFARVANFTPNYLR
jgi:CRP-like cAMP-binding protein